MVLPLVLGAPASASYAHESQAKIEAKAAEFDRAWRDQVVRLYAASFLRAPDGGGADYWNREYRRGFPHHAIATEFAASPEFRTRYGALDNAGFVRLLYRNVMGREADQDGLRHWTGQLDSGRSRGWVLIGFSDSPEFVVKTSTVAPPALAPNPVPLRTTPVPFAAHADWTETYDYPGERHWHAQYPPGDFERIAAHVDFYLASVTGWPAPMIQDWQGGGRTWLYDGGSKGQIQIFLSPPGDYVKRVSIQIKRIA